MIPMIAKRLKNVTWNVLGTKNRPAVSQGIAMSNAITAIVACIEMDMLLSGVINLANEKTILIGKAMASKSVVVIFAGKSDSDWCAGRNG